jgi:hypothetical protein
VQICIVFVFVQIRCASYFYIIRVVAQLQFSSHAVQSFRMPCTDWASSGTCALLRTAKHKPYTQTLLVSTHKPYSYAEAVLHRIHRRQKWRQKCVVQVICKDLWRKRLKWEWNDLDKWLGFHLDSPKHRLNVCCCEALEDPSVPFFTDRKSSATSGRPVRRQCARPALAVPSVPKRPGEWHVSGLLHVQKTIESIKSRDKVKA